jgi:hypothetical protein
VLDVGRTPLEEPAQVQREHDPRHDRTYGPPRRSDDHAVGHPGPTTVQILEMVLVTHSVEGTLNLLIDEAMGPFIDGYPAGHLPSQAQVASAERDLVAKREVAQAGAGGGRLRVTVLRRSMNVYIELQVENEAWSSTDDG